MSKRVIKLPLIKHGLRFDVGSILVEWTDCMLIVIIKGDMTWSQTNWYNVPVEVEWLWKSDC